MEERRGGGRAAGALREEGRGQRGEGPQPPSAPPAQGWRTQPLPRFTDRGGGWGTRNEELAAPWRAKRRSGGRGGDV